MLQVFISEPRAYLLAFITHHHKNILFSSGLNYLVEFIEDLLYKADLVATSLSLLMVY